MTQHKKTALAAGEQSAGRRWEVQTHTVIDGWTNCWSDGDGKPTTFATRAEAEKELKEFLDDVNSQGMGYDLEDYRVVEVDPGT